MTHKDAVTQVGSACTILCALCVWLGTGNWFLGAATVFGFGALACMLGMMRP